MRTAKNLLDLLTISHPPPQGAKHALVVHEDKVHVVLAWADPVTNVCAFKHFTLEDEDLDRPAQYLHADIETLLAQHLSAAPRWPNDHLAPGHVHRPTYAGDGCPTCDELIDELKANHRTNPESALSKDEEEILRHLKNDVSGPTSTVSLATWTGMHLEIVKSALRSLMAKGLVTQPRRGFGALYAPAPEAVPAEVVPPDPPLVYVAPPGILPRSRHDPMPLEPAQPRKKP